MFWLLMGAAAFVLLVACANVSNLTLMRGAEREREMVVRLALGAGHGRLRRLLLVEKPLARARRGVLGVFVSFASLKLLTAFAAQLTPRAPEIGIDAAVLLVGLATSVVAAVFLSFIPRIGVSVSRAPRWHLPEGARHSAAVRSASSARSSSSRSPCAWYCSRARDCFSERCHGCIPWTPAFAPRMC
jgi:hypothetical protein